MRVLEEATATFENHPVQPGKCIQSVPLVVVSHSLQALSPHTLLARVDILCVGHWTFGGLVLIPCSCRTWPFPRVLGFLCALPVGNGAELSMLWSVKWERCQQPTIRVHPRCPPCSRWCLRGSSLRCVALAAPSAKGTASKTSVRIAAARTGWL